MQLLLDKSKQYLLAFSGGPDSLAVFYLLVDGGYMFKCIHVNHGLSDNAERWQAFCQDVAKKHGIECVCASVSVDKTAASIEAEARKLRYQAISKVVAEYSIDHVLTGHHKDDNIETMLFNFFRGGELSTLDGMAESTVIFGISVKRPLLSFSRHDIEKYLKNNSITQWNVDESNFDSSYSRNFLRNDIIPKLREHFDGFDSSMVNFIERAGFYDEYKKEYVKSFFLGNDTNFYMLRDNYMSGKPSDVDLVLSIVYFGASQFSKVFLSRRQLIHLCKTIFTNKNCQSFSIKDKIICMIKYDSGFDSKILHFFNAKEDY